MDYMMTSCAKSHSNNANKKENKYSKPMKLNNTIQKIKNTVKSRNMDKIKQYLPETPNIVKNLINVEYSESGIEILDLNNQILASRFQDLTSLNLKSPDTSGLVSRRYNISKHKIEITNTEEYDLIDNFLNKEEFPELTSEVENINQTSIGKIIMEGYRRYLQNNMFLSFNFHKIFENCHQNKGTWYYVDDIHKNLLICFNDTPEQYQENIDDRYTYQGCMMLVLTKSKNYIRIPLYLDKNGQLGFPSMRKIGKFYFTIFNISEDKELYLDYDVLNQKVYLVSDDTKELVRYLCTHKGICMYEEYPEYLNQDYLDNINKSEEKFIVN